jgi:hypothetical protein
MRTQLPFALLAVAFACSLAAGPAQAAGVARTFVSAAGSDSNNCANVATPCRHFAAAYAATAPSGEIFVLDPANYGSLTITQAVSIEGHGWASIAPPNGGNAITIAAGPFDAITLTGLVIDGAGTGANGISFSAGGYLIIQDCVIRNMPDDGIHFVSNVISHLSVANSSVSKNGENGILVQPVGSASVTAVFERVRTQFNGAHGIALDGRGTGGFIMGTATDTVSSDNVADGFLALANSDLVVVRSVAANNQTGAEGAVGIVTLAQSTLNNNVNSCIGTFTYGDNYVINSHSDGCATTPLGRE